MLCDILKENEKWLAIKSESYEALIKRQIKLNFSQIEEALSFWIEKT
ncbi:15293_t:CDS:1, partial [Funneliformis geosporum]